MEANSDGQTSLWRQKLQQKMALDDQVEQDKSRDKLEESILKAAEVSEKSSHSDASMEDDIQKVVQSKKSANPDICI